jgi:putative lipoprotein
MDDVTAQLDGTEWRVEDVAGGGVLDDVRPTLEFRDGRLAGRASVNRYHGGYSIDGDRLVVGPVAATLMAGPEPAMEQERRWLRAIGQPSVVRAGEGGTVLYLDHEDGTTSRLVRMGPFVTVRGVVTYRARIAMLPGSEIVVTLEDTARADAAAVVVAQQIIRQPGNVPVPFELTVDRSIVGPAARLGLRARIDVDGRLRWTTDTHHPVDLDAEPEEHELVVRQVDGQD